MNIVFLIGRHNFYKFFSSIIEEGLKRGHIIECWHDYTQPRNGVKGHLFPTIENSPFFDCGYNNLKFKKIENVGHFEKLLYEKMKINNVDYFVGLSPVNIKLNKSIIKYLSGKWCIIMHGIDSFYEIKNSEYLNKYKYNKYLFVYSEYFFQFGFEWIKKYYSQKRSYLQDEYLTIVPIGCTMIGDTNKLSSIDSELIKGKYGISNKDKIVLYLPFLADAKRTIKKNDAFMNAFSGIYYNKIMTLKRQKIEIGFKEYLKAIIEIIISIFKVFKYKESRKYFIKGWNEPQVFKAVKMFCTSNNLLLVVKPRIKYAVTDYVRNNADIFVYDDEKMQYPSILQELFSIADLTIGYFSVTVLESISFGVPFLNVESSDLLFKDMAHKSLFSNDDDSMFNFKSAVYNWSTSKMISDFDDMLIEDFEMKAKDRKEYMNKFVGPIDDIAAKRFYEYLENI